MAILELTVESVYFDQKVINRWNYVASGTPSAVSLSYGLIYALGFTNPPADVGAGVDFWSRMRQTQSVDVLYTLVSCRDVYSLTDFFSNPLGNAPGIVAGDPSPTFVAYPYRTNQVTKAVRPGQKRIVGVVDASVTNGSTIVQTQRDWNNNFAIEMTEVQSYDDSGQVLTYKPAVCGKKRETLANGNVTYKYYETEVEQLAHTAQSVVWTAKGNITSQITRKRGRGV